MTNKRVDVAIENAERLLKLAAKPDADYPERTLANAKQAIQWLRRYNAPAGTVRRLARWYDEVAAEIDEAS